MILANVDFWGSSIHGLPVLAIFTFGARSALEVVFRSKDIPSVLHPLTLLAVVLAGLALSAFLIVCKPVLALCTEDSSFIGVTELAIVDFLGTVKTSVLGRVQFKPVSTGLAENNSVGVSITIYTAWNFSLAIDAKSRIGAELKATFATTGFANHSVFIGSFTDVVTFLASLNGFSTTNAPVFIRVEVERKLAL